RPRRQRSSPTGAHDRLRFDCEHDAIGGYRHIAIDRDGDRYGCVAYMATLGGHTVVGFYAP
ncbi:MAG: hypothetical protein R6W96_04770, partial [Clostridia bacterium]